MIDDSTQKKIKVVMCGCHEAGWIVIENLLKSGIFIDYFVILSRMQGEKYGISGYKDFTDLAKKYHIPIYNPSSYGLDHSDDIAFFQKNSFDVLIQGGWQRLFPKLVLDTLKIGALGVHGSSDPLPKGRGRSPLNWSLIQGKKRFVMQLFLMAEGVDDGPIIDSEYFDINYHDDIRTLYYKNVIVTTRMILRSLAQLLTYGYIASNKQAIGKPTYYQRRNEEDGFFDWDADKDVFEIYDFIRAQTKPYPGAKAVINGRITRIWKAQIFDTRITYPNFQYGDVVEIFDNNLVVKCLGGLLMVTDYE